MKTKTALQVVVIEYHGNVLILLPIAYIYAGISWGRVRVCRGKLKYEHRKENAAKDKLNERVGHTRVLIKHFTFMY